VEAAGVEPEAGTTTIGVYANLPNVYRMTDIFIYKRSSQFIYPFKDDYFLNLNFRHNISLFFPAKDFSYEIQNFQPPNFYYI
jgi:hypothetical protein